MLRARAASHFLLFYSYTEIAMTNTDETVPSGDAASSPAPGDEIPFDAETLAPGARHLAREAQQRGEAEAAKSIRVRGDDDEQTTLVVRLTPKAKKAIGRVSDAALGSKMGAIRTKLMEVMVGWVEDPSSADRLRRKLHEAGRKVDGTLTENVHVDMGFPRKLLYPFLHEMGYLPLQGVGYPEVGRFFSALAALTYAEGFEAPTQAEREEMIETVQQILSEKAVYIED